VSGIKDFELMPDVGFADRLEQLLMAEMGWEHVAQPGVRKPTPIHRTGRRVGAGAAAALVAASLIGLVFVVRDDATPDPGNTVVPTSVTPPVTTNPVSSTTTGVPSDASRPVPPALPIFQPLTAGTSYRVARSVIGRSLQFTNPTDGTFGFPNPAGFVVSVDAAGAEPLVAVVDLAALRVFTDPLVDVEAISADGVAALTAATATPPTDFLAYFAALPGVEAGEVTTAEFAGLPAKAMTWRFGAFDGGHPCSGAARGNCVATTWLDDAYRNGWISTYRIGDVGTTYVIDIDGKTVVVEVQDRPGAQQTADSIVIGD